MQCCRLPVFHKLEGHKEKYRKQLSLSMPYAPASADDGSLRIGKPEFIVPPSLCLCVCERDDLDFQLLHLHSRFESFYLQDSKKDILHIILAWSTHGLMAREFSTIFL